MAGPLSYASLSPDRFAELAEAQKPIRIPALDRDLLGAAILQATNRQRRKHGLAPLQFHEAAREAADLQAVAMAKQHFIGHENERDKALRTPLDRIRKVGIRPLFIAENVAIDEPRMPPWNALLHPDGERKNRL